jgi:catechol 2,3-dioxygenase-like lactoylglutathione lyase family enzyme
MKIVLTVFLFLIIISLNTIIAQPSAVDAFSSSIVVSDIDTSTAWYVNNLGLKVRNKLENKARGVTIVNLENQGILIELIEINNSLDKNEIIKEYPQGTKLTGFMKSGFRVAELDEWHQFLEKQKVKFRGRIVTDSHTGKRTFLVEDPDGNIIQFFEK